MREIEGLHASYVGRSQADGARSGDRCLVLSDSGTVMDVRWITGALKGRYGQVFPRDIVADMPGMEMDDSFAFEAGRGIRRVAINVEGVYQAGGTVALLEALESEGHLDTLRHAAHDAVALIRERLHADEEWTIVRQALGQDADGLEASAILAAIETVSAEV